MESQTVGIEIVTHSRVTITRSPSAIWPHIVEPGAWKQGAQLVRQGDRIAAMGPDGTPRFMADEAELEPEVRRTLRLTGLDGALLGWSMWYLEPIPGGTRVGYDVYSLIQVPLGDAGGSPEAAAELQRRYQVISQQRFDAELEALKRLVEIAGAP